MSLPPALIILFGTTGDLAQKKLYPALFALHQSGQLNPHTQILGIGRRDWQQSYYHEKIASSIRLSEPVPEDLLQSFTDRFTYYQMDITEHEAYPLLWQSMDDIERAGQTQGNRLYFLATAPDLFPLVSKQIGSRQNLHADSFRRLMIEKPFGQDLQSARSFNQELRSVFDENEIYRIDHYLGKEMLQNILILRFGNRLFEPAWNREHIDHIQISVLEPFGVEQRSGYYDRSGALRDMVQSHLLQLVALLTMNQPDSLQPDAVRDEKVRVLRKLRPFDRVSAARDVILAQYTTGAAMRAYRDEKGIPEHSLTETYTAMQLWIDNERWQGVPIYIRTGKRLNQSVGKITIVFNQQDYLGMHNDRQANTLVIRIQPEEGIDLRFNIKKPGMTTEIEQARMNACQNCQRGAASPQAYEKLLHDALSGDLSLFTRWDEIEATWTLIDSIQSVRDELPLYYYPAGSQGPHAAERLISRDKKTWLDL